MAAVMNQDAVKKLADQIAQLKKENQDLRIQHLKERMSLQKQSDQILLTMRALEEASAVSQRTLDESLTKNRALEQGKASKEAPEQIKMLKQAGQIKDMSQNLQQAEDKLKQQEESLSAKRKALFEKEKTIESLCQEKQTLDRNLGEERGNNKRLQEQLQNVQRQLHTLQGELEKLRRELAAKEKAHTEEIEQTRVQHVQAIEAEKRLASSKEQTLRDQIAAVETKLSAEIGRHQKLQEEHVVAQEHLKQISCLRTQESQHYETQISEYQARIRLADDELEELRARNANHVTSETTLVSRVATYTRDLARVKGENAKFQEELVELRALVISNGLGKEAMAKQMEEAGAGALEATQSFLSALAAIPAATPPRPSPAAAAAARNNVDQRGGRGASAVMAAGEDGQVRALVFSSPHASSAATPPRSSAAVPGNNLGRRGGRGAPAVAVRKQ